MASETLIIVVGGDYLALEICKEILKTAGHAVVLMWKHTDDRSARMLNHETDLLIGEFGGSFTFINEDPVEPGALRRAGLQPPSGGSVPDPRSYCVVAVSQDDRLNLRVALLARDINDRVRVTLRQFNPLLGHKIQEGLRYNCTAISPAAHAAATFAASAVDPSCFYALPFPTLESMVARVAHRRELGLDSGSGDGADLFGFCGRAAVDFGIAGMTVNAAEKQLQARILSISGRAPYLCQGDEAVPDAELLRRPLREEDHVVVFGPIAVLKTIGPHAHQRRTMRRERLQSQLSEVLAGLRRVEPVLRATIGGSLALYAAFVAFFAFDMHWNVPATMYYVLTTMTTVGYGDLTPCAGCAVGPPTLGHAIPLLVAMLVMLVGVTAVAIFTASVTSGLNATALRRIRGLRHIHRAGHVIVCGAGNVGMLVIDYLRQLGEQVVVVEKNPDNLLVELARDRKLDLLTGDATNDETIAYCAPERAKSMVCVTNSDTANLEAALGARSRTRERGQGAFHIILRIDDLAFGRSIRRHFSISSFSPTELIAPTIAGLARFESTRGRFELFAGTEYEQTFQLAERFQGKDNAPPPAPPERPGYKVRWIPLYAWREAESGKGEAVPIHKFADDVRAGDRLLFMVPLAQFTE
ncbi:MAG TPA: NAD-binding protein [Candidatus Baltobacteraceae bacterium]|nr:NAD-binding protein [Candidatus Baltobacteraceae bacterium]